MSARAPVVVADTGGNVMSQFDELLGYLACIGSQTTDDAGWEFVD
jgi:hypothetical protein